MFGTSNNEKSTTEGKTSARKKITKFEAQEERPIRCASYKLATWDSSLLTFKTVSPNMGLCQPTQPSGGECGR